MIWRLCILIVTVLIAGAARGDQTESEPNSSRFEANGPIHFDEILIGGLPGSYGADSDLLYADYWRFTGRAGAQYRFVGTPRNSTSLFPLDIDLDLENGTGGLEARAVAFGDNQIETLNWTCTTDATYYLIVYEGTGTANGISRYEIACTETIDDTDGPTYPGGSAGIRSVSRYESNGQATAAWHAAEDDYTATGQIRYNVHYSPIEAEVFDSTPVTFTGVLTGLVTGLDPAKAYFFGVRAEDESGNEDSNTRTLRADHFTAVWAQVWMLYE
ncbi:hypothetical protein HQ520_18320 [bacterium]|nr:hypothetical protein [bacterium]